jgi:hypothetical protein
MMIVLAILSQQNVHQTSHRLIEGVGIGNTEATVMPLNFHNLITENSFHQKLHGIIYILFGLVNERCDIKSDP